MSARRLLATAGLELRMQLSGPLFWALVFVAALATLSLNPAAMIASGDAADGGVRPFVNSRYAMAQVFALAGILFYVFFSSLMAGMAVLRDDESRIAELLHSTPLAPGEYVAGKAGGVAGALGCALGIHLLLAVSYFELAPIASLAELRGPFSPDHYLVPALLFALPQVLLAAGLAFAVAERTRRPMTVYLVPTGLVMVSLFFLVSWNPSWLDPNADRLLILLDPTGLRWLRRMVFGVDRGAVFYNSAPFHFDSLFWLNRLLTVTLPLASLVRSARRFRALGRMEGGRVRAQCETRQGGAAAAPFAPLRELAMTCKEPGFLASALHVARTELRELAGQPGAYLFGALVLATILEFAATTNEVFGAPVLLTAGTMATGALEVVTLLLCLLTLFTSVEAASRERSTRLGAILYAYPVRTGALLLGKGLASAVVVALLLAAAAAASLAILSMQGKGAVDAGPFLLIWGVLLGPTFLVWGTFTFAVLALVRDRYAAYSVALLALLFTALGFVGNAVTWVWNWPLWGTLRWSDLGGFDLDRIPLAWNRLAMVAFAFLFAELAVRFFPRTESDAAALFDRLRPRALLRSALRLAPFALPPLLLAATLALAVERGYEGGAARRAADEYWRRNYASWNGVEPPTLARMDLRLRLEPAARTVRVAGRYRMANRGGAPMSKFPFTVGPGFENIAWTVDGVPTLPAVRSGLHVLEPRRPLLPGGEVTIGFAHRAVVPRGFSRNGGALSQYVLPSGVALDSLEPSFLPLPGFLAELGGGDREPLEPRDTPPDLWRQRLPPLIGNAVPFRARVEITAPREYTVNSVGRRVSRRASGASAVTVFETDAPVRALNLVAGRWALLRRDGVEVYFHPRHGQNVEEIAAALVAARRRFSEWFRPYPWRELRLSELPNRDGRARGFPTNLTFSEGLGFLTRSEPRTRLAYVVAAHEAAHQWWGNLLAPGAGPGADVLLEGMANYSTLLLLEAEHGAAGRIELARRMEERYGENRRADGERPLARIRDGSRPGDETAIYDKGAWVLWMLDRQLGRERMLAGLRAFLDRFVESDDHPLLQDLVETLRPQAADPAAFDFFVEQWLQAVVVPEIRISAPAVIRTANGWRVSATVENVGSGRVEVEVVALRQAPGPVLAPGAAEGRTRVRLRPGRPERVAWTVPYLPRRLIVDPDVQVLQLNRRRAVLTLPGAPFRPTA